MYICKIVACLVVALLSGGWCSVPKLIVICLDGISWDKLSKFKLNNITYIIERGALIKKLKPQFPPTSAVNLYSLVTGLFPEVHGVVNDELHDPNLELNLTMVDELTYGYNEGVYPIWNLNELSSPDRYSGVMLWPGGKARINRRTLMYSQPHKISGDYVAHLDEIFRWFTRKEQPVNLVLYYMPLLTSAEKQSGVTEGKVLPGVKLADRAVGYLLEKIQDAGMHEMNIILTSDVGLTPLNPSCDVNIDRLRTFDFYPVGSTPLMTLWGIKDDVFAKYLELRDNMSNYEVFMKPDIPERFRINTCPRVSVLSLKCNKGCYFRYNNQSMASGGGLLVYGADNEDESTHTFMIGYGPSFASGVAMETASNLDVFPLLLSVLKLKSENLNGSLASVKQMLAITNEDIKDAVMLTLIIFLCMISFTVSCMRDRLKDRKEQEANAA